MWRIWQRGTLRLRIDFTDHQYVTVSTVCNSQNLSITDTRADHGKAKFIPRAWVDNTSRNQCSGRNLATSNWVQLKEEKDSRTGACGTHTDTESKSGWPQKIACQFQKERPSYRRKVFGPIRMWPTKERQPTLAHASPQLRRCTCLFHVGHPAWMLTFLPWHVLPAR